MGRTIRRTAAFTALWKAVTASHRGGPGLADRVFSVPRLAWASLRGQYDGSGRFLMMALATLYVISPIDLMPEILLGPLGLIDDGIVVAWIAGAFLSETDRFLQWERLFPKGRRRERPGTARPGEFIDGQVVD
ncbi:MAG: DUF1232 domain-containing protein [Hamadaea sp.]|uniref:YkvA family protein n=1 Tax=Hamadaea sp. TaxID=2024425 RepID=UPI00184EF778|nr:YkvA family protein [Hamadaea sp.]NUR72706.1 DUF1232 domain-containing protein [Hamadaea sp.]NUT22335.1 DUF1232 domain-containing protein [Hamadaea sp.]